MHSCSPTNLGLIGSFRHLTIPLVAFLKRRWIIPRGVGAVNSVLYPLDLCPQSAKLLVNALVAPIDLPDIAYH